MINFLYSLPHIKMIHHTDISNVGYPQILGGHLVSATWLLPQVPIGFLGGATVHLQNPKSKNPLCFMWALSWHAHSTRSTSQLGLKQMFLSVTSPRWSIKFYLAFYLHIRYISRLLWRYKACWEKALLKCLEAKPLSVSVHPIMWHFPDILIHCSYTSPSHGKV